MTEQSEMATLAEQLAKYVYPRVAEPYRVWSPGRNYSRILTLIRPPATLNPTA